MAKQMHTAAKTYSVDVGSYTGLTLPSITAIEPTVTGTIASGSCAPNTVGQSNNSGTGTCNGTATATDYCVSATSISGNTFSIRATSTIAVDRRCSIPAGRKSGACKGTAGGNGTW
jgi:hypothetical protein